MIEKIEENEWKMFRQVCILHDFYISTLRFKVSSQLGKNPRHTKHTSKGKQMYGRSLGLKKLENYSYLKQNIGIKFRSTHP